jgi:hypothetical protein
VKRRSPAMIAFIAAATAFAALLLAYLALHASFGI